MMDLFSGHAKAYGTHGVPELTGLKWGIKNTAKSLRGDVTEELWKNHITGKAPLGIIPIREDNNCLWGSIDIDDYHSSLLGLIDRLNRENIPLVPVQSKSGGLHLFLFLLLPLAASLVQSALKNLAAKLGVANSEIFPKQSKVLTERGDVGNWIIMPYYGDNYDGKLRDQTALRKTGAAMTIEQFLTLAEGSKVGEVQVTEWASMGIPPPRHLNGGGHAADPASPFADGPVCLQILAKAGVQLGGQSNALLNMGIYYKKRDIVNWKENLEQANREFLTPPGTVDGLVSVMRSLDKKDYFYTCKTEPICSHCNSSVCRTRKYGVGEEGDFPALSGMSKLNTEPPLWFVDVNSQRVELTTDDLMNYPKFMKVCMDKYSLGFNLMSQGNWMKVIQPALRSCVNIETPIEVSRAGHFIELLQEFCTNRLRGKTREDLLSGRPWEDEELKRYYFRLKDFQKFLIRENVKDYTRGQITTRIKHVQGDYQFFNIKGQGFNAWYVPSDTFSIAESLSLPKLKGDVM